jgi:hypothetical protein
MNRSALAAAAVLLLAGCGSSAPAATPKGALAGRVLSAPSCPVERVGQPCPPRPVSGAAVVVLRSGRVVASTHADAGGHFHVAVAAGRCLVRATNTGGLATTAAKVVTVQAGQPVYVRLVVDSGIR